MTLPHTGVATHRLRASALEPVACSGRPSDSGSHLVDREGEYLIGGGRLADMHRLRASPAFCVCLAQSSVGWLVSLALHFLRPTLPSSVTECSGWGAEIPGEPVVCVKAPQPENNALCGFVLTAGPAQC